MATIDAKAKFSVGRRVKLTAQGIKHFAYNPEAHNASTRGKVVGFSRDPRLVRILRDGRKTAHNYHVDFWETAPEQTEMLTVITAAPNPFTGQVDGTAHTHTVYDREGNCLGGGIEIKKPHHLEAPEGPTCSCGKPSTHESGWCGVCCVACGGPPQCCGACCKNGCATACKPEM